MLKYFSDSSDQTDLIIKGGYSTDMLLEWVSNTELGCICIYLFLSRTPVASNDLIDVRLNLSVQSSSQKFC